MLASLLCCLSYYSTELVLPAGTWRGSHNAPGLTRVLKIKSGLDSSGTGTFVWHSGIVMANWLGQNADLVKHKAVLELGCGTGAVSIFAAGLGASRVLATDGGSHSVLQLATENIDLNRPAYHPDASVQAVYHRWGDALPESMSMSWDVILASDVTYSRASHAPLCDTIATLCKQESADNKLPPRALLAHTHRLGDPPLEEFYECAASRGLTSSLLEHVDELPRGEDESVRVSILELGIEHS